MGDTLMTCAGVAAALLASAFVPGCSQPKTAPVIAFDAGGYEAVFQATKDTLREYQFDLERVDARNGVITTWPRQWAGLATPWIPHATDGPSAVVGLMQHELRSCRVTFERAAATDPNEDLRDVSGELTAKVDVTIHRVQRPGGRIGAPSVRLRSQAIDPALVRNGQQPQFVASAGVDEALAARIARDIETRASGAPIVPTGSEDVR